MSSSSGKSTIKDISRGQLSTSTIFLRADLNVPQDKKTKEISDDSRIRASIPTIKYLLDAGAKVVISSHLGRPKSPDPSTSLAPVARRLSQLLDTQVPLAPDCIGDEVEQLKKDLKPGNALLLENVRWHPEEEKNDKEFARMLSSLCDVFVMDAFGSAHRAHASTVGVAEFLSPRVSGFLMEKELDYLMGALESPLRPFGVVIGGAKISTKIGVIETCMDKCDKLILAGGMAFTFLKAKGLEVGSSIVEDSSIELAKRLMATAEERSMKLILPVDVVVAEKFSNDAASMVVDIENIPSDYMGLDIGPKSLEIIKRELEDCKTCLWNGPVGVFEFENFAHGTIEVAKIFAELHDAVTVVGGGDSVAAVEGAGVADKMSHISSGGGAALELLEGKTLPGVAILDDKPKE